MFLVEHAKVVMKVICPHCREKSTISSSNRISTCVIELYCQCENELCDAGFVMTLAHKHDTRPPKSQIDNVVAELVRRMSSEEKREVMKLLSVIT